jgi:hypothetical protein
MLCIGYGDMREAPFPDAPCPMQSIGVLNKNGGLKAADASGLRSRLVVRLSAPRPSSFPES